MNFRAQVKADIEADMKKGILERGPEGEHDTWCSRMVIHPKKNGKAQRTVDLSYLSNHGLDKSHHTYSAPVIAKVTMMSWNRVQRATQEDGTLLRLIDHIQRGMQDSGLELDKDLREFHRYRHDLHVVF